MWKIRPVQTEFGAMTLYLDEGKHVYQVLEDPIPLPYQEKRTYQEAIRLLNEYCDRILILATIQSGQVVRGTMARR